MATSIDRTDSSYFDLVMSEIESEMSDTDTFDNYHGARQSVDMLKERIVLPFLFPHLFTSTLSLRLTTPLMLFGPPGCGKSHLLKACAKEAKQKLFVFRAWDLQHRIIGGEERAPKLIDAVFEITKNNAPCILCLEDLDVFSREGSHFKEGRRALLNKLMSDYFKDKTKRVFVIGTTQRPWDIDCYMRRLFQRYHGSYVDLPDPSARKQHLESLLKSMSHDLKSEDLDEIADRTRGFTGSDLICLVQSASMAIIRELMKATHFKKVPFQVDPVVPPRNAAEIQTMSRTTERDISHAPPDTVQEHLLVFPPDSLEQKQKTSQDKFTLCNPKDEGAVSMSFLDVSEDQLYIKHDITLASLKQELLETRPTISDEDLSKHQRYVEDFLPE